MDRLKKAGDLAKRFSLEEAHWLARPYGNGHINETFVLEAEDCNNRYILQWLNGYVFPNSDDVMENIAGVTAWLKDRILEEGGDPERETLTVIPAKSGELVVKDEKGGAWRVFRFVEDAYGLDRPENTAVFEETGRGFGRFQRRLAGYAAGSLKEVIRGFHDTPGRYRQLISAIEANVAERLGEVGPEVDFCKAHEQECGELLQLLTTGRIPLRVTHNDTKVNNLLLDATTGRALCVIDLDTVMPGLAAYDFGDAIRTGASTAAEDERDLSRVGLSLHMYAAFTRGFISEVGSTMDMAEILSLPIGAKLMTLENGLRFLADHLNGDRYFRVHHPGQNLDRARAQFALVEDIERKMKDMEEIVTTAAENYHAQR